MSQQQQENRDYVFVRSKRTKRIDICRANELSPHRGTYPKSYDHTIHYVGLNRDQICRCSDPRRHGSKVFIVASESIHLSASLALYMSRHNLELCTGKEFQEYSRRRETEWAEEGVFVNNFHYGSYEKNIVCRCTQPDDHGYGVPRNPEIIEQCAEYFCLYRDKMNVSKKQWRRINGDTPPSYCPETSAEAQSSQELKIKVSINSGEERADTSMRKRGMKMRSDAVTHTPQFGISHNYVSEMKQELEMPPKVWQNARPSLWGRLDSASSTVTTPLGSPYSFSGDCSGCASAPLVGPTKTAPIDNLSKRGSDPFVFSTYLNQGLPVKGASGNELDTPTAASGDKFQGPRLDKINWHTGHNPSANKRLWQPSGHDGHLSQRVPYNPYVEKYIRIEAIEKEVANNMGVSERFGQMPAAELRGDAPLRQHTPTLERLEGRNWAAISEMKSTPKKTTEKIEMMSNRMSSLSQNTELFDSLVQQIQSSPVLSRTDREMPLNTSVSASKGDELDGGCQALGKPLNGLYVSPASEATLADGINAQREAIFGAQMTPLKDELRVEFPQRSEIVMCTSEEDVFVAQLLLINDHVDTHAIGAVHLFEATGTEPNWHADVVQPAIMLLQGWNRSFSDLISYMHEVFLNLLAWAELLRLMKDGRVLLGRARGRDAMGSWLVELHDRLIEAKELYKKGKEKWRIDMFGPLSCDKVACYVVANVMETRTL